MNESNGLPVIEKGIPIPPRYSGGRSWYKVLAGMESGDSFAVEEENLRVAILGVAKRNGIRVVSRKVPEKGWRIWRIGNNSEPWMAPASGRIKIPLNLHKVAGL
jgi:hypothetical protein